MNPFPAWTLIMNGLFVFCLATTAAGALIAVASVRLIRAVCGLAICCFGLAGLYYFLQSPFLALMEILIYVGAVCVTIVFAVMLAEPDEPGKDASKGFSVLWTGIAVTAATAIFLGVERLALSWDWVRPEARVNDGSMKAVGTALLTTYSMAFELISLALLVAILGALAIARTGRTKP
ncbi:MAG TPA: NADH-quinone oxidoreductase subunit J [Phycisphaerae bacterium]|nr:NADH-quinone oxidoreductase subunit J [Phycisphaerae bacterium]